MVEFKLPKEEFLQTITFKFTPIAFFYLYLRSLNQIFLVLFSFSLIIYVVHHVIVRYFRGVAKKKGYKEGKNEHKVAEHIVFDNPSLITVIISIVLFSFSMISLLKFIKEIEGFLLFMVGIAGIVYVFSYALWGKNRDKTFRLLKKFRRKKFRIRNVI